MSKTKQTYVELEKDRDFWQNQATQWQQKFNEAIQEFQDSDRKSQLKGWALDRAIRYVEVTGNKVEGYDTLKSIADSFVEYTHKPHVEAHEKVNKIKDAA